MVKETLEAPYSRYLLDADLSQEVDRRTIQEMGIDGFTLMEVAGSSAAKKLLQEIPTHSHGVYLCGKGNNGGDALVIARYLIQNNIKATVVFLSGSDDLSPDAKKNFDLLQKFDSASQLTTVESWNDFNPQEDFDFIVDGMLGTGLKSDVRGAYAKAVEWANNQSASTFSIDIPTGLHAGSGKIMGCAIDANRTFAFGGLKQGFYLDEGPSQTGTVDYCELPFPNAFKNDCSTYLLDERWIQMKPPSPGKHKYDSGVLYLVAGSEGLSGAAIMAAQSAWAEGPGAVILIGPRGILPAFEENLPSIIKKPVGSRDDYFFTKEHLEKVLSIIQEKKGTVLLGPGLGRADETVNFVEQFLSQNDTDTIIDADGLWCLSQLTDWEKPDQSNWILTPHHGELNRLTQEKIESGLQRLESVRQFAQKHNVTILSKGMPGILGTPSGKCYLTDYNTRYFARAGSGDVLAGKVSAFLAMGRAPDLSCSMGLLNGKEKLEYFLNHHQGLPEPKDFI